MHGTFLGAALAALATATTAQAFVSFGGGLGSKWGPDPAAGTPAVVTWSFVPDGTPIDPGFVLDPFSHPGETGFAGTSNLGALRQRIDVTLGRGAGAFDAAVARAFATWSAAANITFVGPVTDNGAPLTSAGATTPDIRIAAFQPAPGHSFNFVGAVGFGPPGFGPDPLAGDIMFNLAATIDVVIGTEDLTPMPPFTNDLEGLLLHELGHAAIGLGHPSWNGANPDQRVMYVGDFANPEAPFCCQTVNRELHPDDRDGAWFTYGIRGDYNADGRVNAADYTAWRDGLGTTYAAADYTPFANHYGGVRPTAPTATTSVPEHASVLLVSLSAIAWTQPRRLARPLRLCASA
ncbi:MAG: matrixin family metalloprotease [Lacipirellulaceae bacterium]